MVFRIEGLRMWKERKDWDDVMDILGGSRAEKWRIGVPFNSPFCGVRAGGPGDRIPGTIEGTQLLDRPYRSRR